jgi:predicted CXXCH cytochrome family protein
MPKRLTTPLLMIPVLVLCQPLTARRAGAETTSASLQQYAGSETCGECHEDEYASYRKSVHFQTETENWPVKGCEACHGPGAQHAETGDPEAIFSFANPSYTVEQKAGKCLTCHAGRENTFDFLASPHSKGGIDCSTCHKPHAGAGYVNLLPPVVGDDVPIRKAISPGRAAAAMTSALCLTCHKEWATPMNLNERHRVLEGVVKCTDCHSPHAPSTRSQLGGFKQETCLKCHTDKRGPWVYEHGSVRVEGCTACHTPHGSVNRHMLLYQRTADLCFSCHAVVPSFHTRFTHETVCTNCHSQIHGSNLSPVFLH